MINLYELLSKIHNYKPNIIFSKKNFNLLRNDVKTNSVKISIKKCQKFCILKLFYTFAP